MVKLRRLKIHRYRTLAPGTELFFNDGMNLIIGKNGSGKTTLLNLLAMVFGGDFSALQREEFSIEYDLSLDRATLKVALRNALEDVRDPDGQSGEDERSLRLFRFDLVVDYRTQAETPQENSFRLHADNDSTNETNIDGNTRFRALVSPFYKGGNFLHLIFMIKRRRRIIAEFSNHRDIVRFDEALEWLVNIIKDGSATLSEITEYDGRARYTEPVNSRILSQHAADVLARALYDKKGAPQSLHLVAAGWPLLGRAAKALDYADSNVEYLLVHSEQGLSAGEVIYQYGSPRFLFVKADGSRIPLDSLSFGEKRLFAFYYYLDTFEHVLIADELTNGMHHAMIDGCLEALEGRQAFIATQNPLLLDHVGFTSAQEVKSTFVLCKRHQEGRRERMVLTQLSDEEAAAFYDDYKVGIQHVNEVLRARGLW